MVELPRAMLLLSWAVLISTPQKQAVAAPPTQASGNAWLQLPADYQNALRGPLNNSKFYPWAQARFNAWFERWFFSGGRPRPGVGPKETYFHAFFFNELISRDDRNALLLVFAKLRRENLWSLVKTVRWGGVYAALVFEPTMAQSRLKTFLEGRGFGDWWLASKGNPWGVRSRFGGPQLHFRGGDFVNVHIDLNNPGDPASGETTGALSEVEQALRHLNDDLRHRTETHTNAKVREALRRQGMVVPVVD